MRRAQAEMKRPRRGWVHRKGPEGCIHMCPKLMDWPFSLLTHTGCIPGCFHLRVPAPQPQPWQQQGPTLLVVYKKSKHLCCFLMQTQCDPSIEPAKIPWPPRENSRIEANKGRKSCTQRLRRWWNKCSLEPSSKEESRNVFR